MKDDQDVVDRARAEGFELVERPVAGQWCWGFIQENDERYPAFLERRQAMEYMADWLRRARVFE
jgi:hypothetical protein